MPKTLTATRHFKLAQALREAIRKMKPGDPLPTVMELRQQFGCSQATVERALDRLRREGLIDRPAGQLRLTVAAASDPAKYRVALVRPDYPSPTFEELCRVIVEAGKERDWAFEWQSYRFLDGLDLNSALGDADGGVLLPTSEPFPAHLLAGLERPRRPLVVIQDPPPVKGVGVVRMDDEEIGRLAVEHLRSLGHRRILMLHSEPSGASAELRAKGWRAAMEALGEADIDSLVVDPKLRPFDNTMLQTYEFFAKWLASPTTHFTAVFCPAWTGAAAALRALRERNIAVPAQVSVVAHGGESKIGPFLYPPLTAVETDLVAYGRAVIDTLESMFQTNKPGEPRIIHSTLVKRASSGPVPASLPV